MYVDPTGHSITAILIGALIGACVAFGATACVDYADDGEVFNGSISLEGYIANTIVGAIVGGLVGYGVGATATNATTTLSKSTISRALSSINSNGINHIMQTNKAF